MNVMVAGILFRISLTKAEELSGEIENLKSALLRAIAENVIPEMES